MLWAFSSQRRHALDSLHCFPDACCKNEVVCVLTKSSLISISGSREEEKRLLLGKKGTNSFSQNKCKMQHHYGTKQTREQEKCLLLLWYNSVAKRLCRENTKTGKTSSFNHLIIK